MEPAVQGLRAVVLGRSVAVCEQPLTRLRSGRVVGGPSRYPMTISTNNELWGESGYFVVALK